MPIHKKANKDFFKVWTPEMAYVLGFFAADGSMYQNKRGGAYIAFEITDADLLEKIRSALGANHKTTIRVRTRHCKPIHRLQIGSRVIFEDLQRLGFIQNKTMTLSWPHIPREFLSHFARGYFDGDGNVWKGTIHKFDRPNPSNVLLTCFTSGSEGFFRGLKEELRLNPGMDGGSLYFSKAFRLQYATRDSSRDSLKLYRFMYYDSRGLHLERKKQVFEEFIAMRV